MLYTVAFVACLFGQPASCRAFELQTDAQQPVACLMAAQQLMAQWSQDHPKWTIKASERVRCAPMNRKGVDI